MRDAVKALARGVSLVVVAPVLLYFYAVSAAAGRDRVLESCSQALALVPGLAGQYMRRAFLSHALEYCGPTAAISFGVVFSASGARVGDGAYIGPFCTIGLAHIEADTLIAAGTHIPSGQHTHGTSTAAAIRDQAGQRRVVKIGPGAWIGNNAVVMADVGEESIVGAGAVVTKAIPPRVVAAGVPARVIRERAAADERA